ncbi:hypothetical protein SAMN02745226_01850 [Fervidobacterium gondwanense DSM 13020]|uniref:Uncharacterized protein n=1 Tax=Fervidobacterium gondwanense DSM 13020 TaxID=1121883 RepID=A0A1M7TCX4_FERGO|nr:hypothetical protein SAMN02745226_01850 [Fervidobacterium gondwanense DSM 13020]
MVVVVVVMAMLGLIFDITLRVLNERQEYTSFYSEIQHISDIINNIFTNSVSSIKAEDVSLHSIQVPSYRPTQQYNDVVTQRKVLQFKPNNKTLVFDGKTIAKADKIDSIEFEYVSSRVSFIMITFKHKNGKWRYSLPMLSALSEAS